MSVGPEIVLETGIDWHDQKRSFGFQTILNIVLHSESPSFRPMKSCHGFSGYFLKIMNESTEEDFSNPSAHKDT